MDVLEGGAIALAIGAAFVVLAIVASLIGVVADLILALLFTAVGAAGRLLSAGLGASRP
jgi:flagellar biosynthesis protein FliR